MIKDSDIKIYSRHNESRSVVAERLVVKTLKIKIYKYMTSISKNVFGDKVPEIVTKYNEATHTPIKKKPVNVKRNKYINFSVESNIKKLKSTVVMIWEYQSIKIYFQKSTHQIG